VVESARKESARAARGSGCDACGFTGMVCANAQALGGAHYRLSGRANARRAAVTVGGTSERRSKGQAPLSGG
jgi:hypothetical protein